jgi:general secretion pathway protein D
MKFRQHRKLLDFAKQRETHDVSTKEIRMKRILIPALAGLFALGTTALAQDDFDLDSLLDDFGSGTVEEATPAAEAVEEATEVAEVAADDAFAGFDDAAADGAVVEEDVFAEVEEAVPEEPAEAFDDLFTDITPDAGAEEAVPAEDPFAGFDEAADDAADAFAGFADETADAVADAADDTAAAFDDFADDAGEAFADAAADAGDALEEVFEEDIAEVEEVAAPAAVSAGAADAIKESARKAAAQEEIRRQSAEADAAKASEAGYHALSANKPAEAERLFNEALNGLVDRPQSAKLRQQTLWGLAEARQLQAKAAMEQGDLAGAREFLDAALKSDPTHRAAVALDKKLSRMEAEEAKGKPPARQTATIDKRKEVEDLYAEGRQWFAIRDYDRAQVLFERVLARDPYHKSALRYIGRIERARRGVAEIARDARREGMLSDVTERWNPPLPTYVEIPAETPVQAGTKKESPSDHLQAKMREIIIPMLEFRQANIADVVNFLVKASVDADPEKEGINIILNLGPGGANVPSAPAAAAPADDEWGSGWDDGGFGDDMSAGGSTGGGANDITLNLRRVSVFDAIKYITEVAGLKYRVEDRAVIITSLDAPIGSLISRIYPVEPSIIESVIEREENNDRNSDFVAMNNSKVNKSDIQQFFEQAGVPFPAGAKCTYRNSRIIVRNTADNLEIFERILQEFNVVPSQIEIEARFIEVGQSDLDELGLQWIFNDNWEIATKKDGSGQHIQIDANANGVTQGLRFFGQSSDSSVTPMTPMAAAASGTSSLLGNILSFTGVLTNPEVSVVIQALSQHGGADLLSAPRVTARSEEPALIQVVREIIYPTEFTVTQPSVDSDGNVTMGPISEPGSFVTRGTGVILNVTPTVGPDGYTIELVLAPEVCELVEWLQYGSNIEIPGQYGTQVWTYNMPQPVFASRNVVTKISIWDGHTVVLGGLIREQVTTIKDKVPILGDIPLIGRLFRSEGQYSEKKNLLIFVTARLVDPAGRPVHSDLSMPGQGVDAGNDAVDAE